VSDSLKTGMTWRRGKREVNIHDVKDGVVYYGLYDDDAHDAPEHCIGLYQRTVADFSQALAALLADER